MTPGEGRRPITTQAVRSALDTVIDPCSRSMGSPRSIVDLGLIEDVRVDGATVYVELVLTDPMCVFYREISDAVRGSIQNLLGVPGDDVHVDLDGRVLWTPERMATARHHLPRSSSGVCGAEPNGGEPLT